MELKLLEYIIAISEQRSIARAADDLFLSRSALNRQLLNLEKRLGLPLFKRLNNSLRLTYAGEVYVEMARKMLEIERKGEKHLADIAGGKSGRINLGINQGRAFNDFSNIFPRFHEKYPGIKVSLTGGQRDELEQLVLSGQVDIAIVASGGRFEGLHYQMLQREEVVLAIPASHPMAHMATQYAGSKEPEQIDLKWFADDYFALMDPGTRAREISDMLFSKEDFKPKILLEDSFVSVAYNMVKSAVCNTILSRSYVNENDPIVCFSLKPRCYLIMAIVYREREYLSQAEKYLVSLIDDYYNGSSFKKAKVLETDTE